ncbi:MAG TPA: MFS transporter [Pyrinomonadaceae bacterium]
MASLTYKQLISGNRSFRRLLAGQVVSELGNWFNFIAGLGLVRAVTGAAPEPLAILVVLRLAPFALFAPLAGAVADRLSRRTVMIVTDVLRALLALGFLLVRGPEDLWIAYVCTFGSTVLAAFFEGAKNAALANVVGGRGLLAGNALMFSSRFLLMSVGSALGGEASAAFGYDVAFVINALSFLVSAYSIWLIPGREMHAAEAVSESGDEDARGTNEIGTPAGSDVRAGAGKRAGYLADVLEGWRYVVRHPLVAAIFGINIMWALGGGGLNLVYERLGAVVFAEAGGLQPDRAVSMLYTAAGAGLFVGMFLARRVGAKIEVRGATARFMGWTLIAHGILFALSGLMPSIWWCMLMMFLSRAVIGVEFAIQETLLLRLLPDRLRGRVTSSDRAAEILMMSLTTAAAGWLLGFALTPRSLTVVSGLLCGSPGIVWLLLFASGKLRMPERPAGADEDDEEGETALASAN